MDDLIKVVYLDLRNDKLIQYYQELWDYVELIKNDNENNGRLNMGNEIQFKIEEKINKLKLNN